MPESGISLGDSPKGEVFASKTNHLRRVPLKAALVLAFGLTVGIWVFAGFYFGQRVASLENRTAGVNQRYLSAQQLLSEARNQVLLSSVYVRDALLDPREGASEAGRTGVIAALDLADGNLSRYEPILNTNQEQERIARLRREISALRGTMVQMLDVTAADWPSPRGVETRRRLIERREGIMDIAGELGTLNRKAFVEHQVEMAVIYRNTQYRIWQVLGLALAASLGIAVLALFYAGRLELHVREQREKDTEMRRDLQRLSMALLRVREDERRALARELHDDIGQMLTAIKVELAVAQRTIEESGGARDVLDDARPIVDRAMHAIRDLSHILHPAVLDDLGLPAAVDWFMKSFRRRHAIRAEFQETGMEDRLTLDVETAAYRIIQEALTNVAKHASASWCRVSLVGMSGRLLLEIADDGVGFERSESGPARSARGLGLVSMRERAVQLGGTLAIHSGAGQGTRIVVELPATIRGESGAAELDYTLRPATAAAN